MNFSNKNHELHNTNKIMVSKTLQPLTLEQEQANENSKAIFTGIKSKIGMLPNLYASMGISDKLLGGFLAFSDTLKSGEFTAKEYEAIALATSQANGCDYCLSAHTTIGKMNGFTEEETLALRSNTIANYKLNALVTLASAFINTKGHPSETDIQNFFEAGYNKVAFAELIAIVSLTTITNTVFHNGGFEIDFPKAQSLEQLQDI